MNRWSLTVNALRLLPINRLDLRESGLADAKQLANLELMELDIRNTNIRDLAPLKEMRSLRLLIVESGKFKKEQIRKLGNWIKVQEK